MEVPNICCVCLIPQENLTNAVECDSNRVKWSHKLKFCVPEVEWEEDNPICQTCTHQLDIVYTFRTQCIQSDVVRKQQRTVKETVKTEDVLYKDELLQDAINSDDCESTTQYSCEQCPNQYPTKSSLDVHVKNHHHNKSSKFTCYHCNETHSTKTKLIRHIRTQHTRTEIDSEPETVPNCGVCGVNFSSKYLLKRHVRNVHATEKNYKCDVCDQKFASPVYLSAHKRYHSGDRPYICSFCGKGFKTASDLYHHEKIHANKRAYKCEKCPKAFNTSSDLHKHNICVHTDRAEWKYACEYCQRRFPLKTNLDTHTKTHTGERNFACHLCERKCINRSVLMRHVESHSNVRMYKCSVCSQEYKYQKSLDIHLKKVHGLGDAKVPERVKRHFCHICFKSYFANKKLQRHIRSHTGERPFSCHLCDKRFVDSSYVKMHLKITHHVTSEDQ